MAQLPLVLVYHFTRYKSQPFGSCAIYFCIVSSLTCLYVDPHWSDRIVAELSSDHIILLYIYVQSNVGKRTWLGRGCNLNDSEFSFLANHVDDLPQPSLSPIEGFVSVLGFSAKIHLHVLNPKTTPWEISTNIAFKFLLASFKAHFFWCDF